MSIKAIMSEHGLEPFTLDWTEFFERHGLDIASDAITSAVWTVTGGTAGGEYITGPYTTIFFVWGCSRNADSGRGCYTDKRRRL